MNTEERKQKLMQTLDDCEASENLKERYEKNFERMGFKDDYDFEDWLDELAADLVTKQPKDLTGGKQGVHGWQEGNEGGKGASTNGNQGKKKGKIRPEVEAYIKHQQEKARTRQYSTMVGIPAGTDTQGWSHSSMYGLPTQEPARKPGESMGKAALNNILGNR